MKIRYVFIFSVCLFMHVLLPAFCVATDTVKEDPVMIEQQKAPTLSQNRSVKHEATSSKTNRALSDFLSPLLAAVIGGAIAGYFSLKATKNAHNNNIKQLVKNQEIEITSLLQSINDEVTALWETYLLGIGTELEKLEDGKPFVFTYPITQQDYFTVYSNNSSKIGKIADNDLRKKIIHTYISAKSLLDSFQYNNEILKKFQHWNWLFVDSPKPAYYASAEAQKKELIKYAKSLKLAHNIVKDNVDSLSENIRKELKNV